MPSMNFDRNGNRTTKFRRKLCYRGRFYNRESSRMPEKRWPERSRSRRRAAMSRYASRSQFKMLIRWQRQETWPEPNTSLAMQWGKPISWASCELNWKPPLRSAKFNCKRKILPWASNGSRRRRETRVPKVSSSFDGRRVRRYNQPPARISGPGRRNRARERSRDTCHDDLHILAFDPPNRSIPLKNFLVTFQSERRTDRTSPEGVGAHLPPVRQDEHRVMPECGGHVVSLHPAFGFPAHEFHLLGREMLGAYHRRCAVVFFQALVHD